MAHRRIIAVFSAYIIFSLFLFWRLYSLTEASGEFKADASHWSYTLNVGATRGMIYDRNMLPLVNETTKYVAAVMPTAQSSAIISVLAAENREPAVAQFLTRKPFLIETGRGDITIPGVDIFELHDRYTLSSVAPHIVGYIAADTGQGVFGIEKSYDSELLEMGTKISVTYDTDGLGKVLAGSSPKISSASYGKKGLVLTIDKALQRFCEEIAKEKFEKGAIVVMDVHNGEILAMVSQPAFSRLDLAASLGDAASPFINRASCAYNVGSTFKIVTAAAAIESGIPHSRVYNCPGWIDVHGVIFKCNNLAGHGDLDMYSAIEGSCNIYFIKLAADMNPKLLLTLASGIGYGGSDLLARGMATQKGSVPSQAELLNPAAVANLSFGQGELTATPVQIAKTVAMAANGGRSVNPHVVMGYSDDAGGLLEEAEEEYATRQLISPQTASFLKSAMVNVVNYGTGRNAQPFAGGAGGKTASAQTGVFDSETDEEYVHAWFSGFYPAGQPKYAIVVLAENGMAGGSVCAPIFKEICDYMYITENNPLLLIKKD